MNRKEALIRNWKKLYNTNIRTWDVNTKETAAERILGDQDIRQTFKGFLYGYPVCQKHLSQIQNQHLPMYISISILCCLKYCTMLRVGICYVRAPWIAWGRRKATWDLWDPLVCLMVFLTFSLWIAQPCGLWQHIFQKGLPCRLFEKHACMIPF